MTNFTLMGFAMRTTNRENKQESRENTLPQDEKKIVQRQDAILLDQEIAQITQDVAEIDREIETERKLEFYEIAESLIKIAQKKKESKSKYKKNNVPEIAYTLVKIASKWDILKIAEVIFKIAPELAIHEIVEAILKVELEKNILKTEEIVKINPQQNSLKITNALITMAEKANMYATVNKIKNLIKEYNIPKIDEDRDITQQVNPQEIKVQTPLLNFQHRDKLTLYLTINPESFTPEKKNLIKKLISAHSIFKKLYIEVSDFSKNQKEKQSYLDLFNILNLDRIPIFQKKLISELEKYQAKWFKNKDKKRYINLLIEILKKTNYEGNREILYQDFLLARNTMFEATYNQIKKSEFLKTIDKCIFEFLPPEKKKIIQELESYKNKLIISSQRKKAVTLLMNRLMSTPFNESWTDHLKKSKEKLNPLEKSRFLNVLNKSIMLSTNTKNYTDELKKIFSKCPSGKHSISLFSTSNIQNEKFVLQNIVEDLLKLSINTFHMINLNELDAKNPAHEPSFLNAANFFNELANQVIFNVLQSSNDNEWRFKTLQFIKITRECLKLGDLNSAAAITAALNDARIFNRETNEALTLLNKELYAA
ncbi:MAG: hypothetical protein JO131_06770, partial [Gammaproteobacteria bacterium]|nr:hypothetical protein [Gammaproteobacteria bacterium]